MVAFSALCPTDAAGYCSARSAGDVWPMKRAAVGSTSSAIGPSAGDNATTAAINVGCGVPPDRRAGAVLALFAAYCVPRTAPISTRRYH